LKTLLHRALAFLRRDYRIESSYKLNFVLRAAESLMLLMFFYFLGELVTNPEATGMKKYAVGYFPFVVVGTAFARYFDLTLRMFSESIRNAQVTGCLEAMLSSQTDPVTVVLLSSLYSLISGAIQLILILAAAMLIFGLNLTAINIPATILVFVLSILTFVAFGVLSAAAILWLKRGDPVTWLLGGVGTILGGAYFPVDVMPSWLQKIAFLLPVTYSLDALRLTMLRGYSIPMISRPLTTLTIMAAILLPASLYVFILTVRKGRREGTLMQY
jgi:ABC-2 type transport system permease protein